MTSAMHLPQWRSYRSVKMLYGLIFRDTKGHPLSEPRAVRPFGGYLAALDLPGVRVQTLQSMA